jgi:hypothetical protein
VRFLDQLDASVGTQTCMALLGHPQPAPHFQSRAQRVGLEGKRKPPTPSSHHFDR